MSGLDGVEMAIHLRAVGESQLEKATGEFPLASFTDLASDRVPHAGDENEVLQCRVTTEFTISVEIPSRDSGEPTIGDAVEVDDAGQLGSFPISVEQFILGGLEAMNAGGSSHGGQEGCNQPQNVLGF